MISIRKLFTFHAFVLVLIAFVPPESFAQKNEIVGVENCTGKEARKNPACRTKVGGRDERAGAGGEEEGDVERAVQEGVRRTVMACMRACRANTDEERRACANSCRAQASDEYVERGGRGGDDQELAQGRQEDPNAQVRPQSCRDAEGGANPACRTKDGGRDERAGAGDEAEERQQRDQSKACMRKCQRGSEVEKKSCQKRCVR